MVVTISFSALFSIALCFNLFHDAQLRSNDFLFRAANLSQSKELEENVVIVGIDDKSLNKLGHFTSWPRSHYARLIDILNKANVRVIAFDVLFSEPLPDDEQLASAIRNAGNVVLPCVETSTGSNSAITDKPGVFLRPLADLENSAIAIGHANFFPDMDGIVRRLPVILKSGEEYAPSLALAAVAKYLRRPGVIESEISDNALPFAGRLIPINSNNEMIINFMNMSENSVGLPCQRVSFVDILREDFDPTLLENKIVILGATASGLGDTFWTPIGQMMNGVEIHAHAMNTILTGHFLKLASSIVTIATILILAVLCGLISLRFRLLWAIASTLSLCVLYFLIVSACFDKGIVLNTLYPFLTILGTFVGINLFNIASERSRRNEITKTFGRYVSTTVADKIVTALDQGELNLGGDEQEVTVAFADIRRFTTIAENIQPEELIRILNIYLSIVIQSVLKYQGVINKFGGDSIMAIWNVPTACENHPLMAIKAAVESQRAITELHYREPSLPKMDFGIGINTGRAVAGNMGSQDRVEYSVIGDTVNLAARLTDIAQSGKIWLGSNTFKLVKNHISAKPLGKMALKGRQQTVKVYEVRYIRPESIVRMSPINSSDKMRWKFSAAN